MGEYTPIHSLSVPTGLHLCTSPINHQPDADRSTAEEQCQQTSEVKDRPQLTCLSAPSTIAAPKRPAATHDNRVSMAPRHLRALRQVGHQLLWRFHLSNRSWYRSRCKASLSAAPPNQAGPPPANSSIHLWNATTPTSDRVGR